MNREYESPSATAKRWSVTRQRVMQILNLGLIPGAKRETDQLGRTIVLIPRAAKKPKLSGKPGPKSKNTAE